MLCVRRARLALCVVYTCRLSRPSRPLRDASQLSAPSGLCWCSPSLSTSSRVALMSEGERGGGHPCCCAPLPTSRIPGPRSRTCMSFNQRLLSACGGLLPPGRNVVGIRKRGRNVVGTWSTFSSLRSFPNLDELNRVVSGGVELRVNNALPRAHALDLTGMDDPVPTG